MKIKIRKAKESDITKLSELLEVLHSESAFKDLADFSAESVQYTCFTMINSTSAEVLVAEVDGELIGCSSFFITPFYFNADVPIAYGVFFWVNPEYRKHGVGKALYEQCMSLAKLMGATGTIVGVAAEDDYLEQYHTRNGFTLFEKQLIKKV